MTYDGIPRYPSRFITDIDRSFLEYTEKPDESLIEGAKKYCVLQSRHLRPAEKLNLFEPGQRVEHAVFGTGTVLEINMEEESYLVHFDSMPTPPGR